MTWLPWLLREQLAVMTERAFRLEAANALLTGQLAEQTRIAGLAIDQIGAKAGVLSEPTFSSTKRSTPVHGMGALPRLFANMGSSVITKPGQDARIPRDTGNGLPPA